MMVYPAIYCLCAPVCTAWGVLASEGWRQAWRPSCQCATRSF